MTASPATMPDPDSIWMTSRSRPSLLASRPPERVDVVVVGAGLAGLCTAYQCHTDGASVMVVEAGHVAARTTGHSTAKITALHGLIYDRLRRGKGIESAIRYAAGNAEAVRRLRQLATRLGIDCELTTASAYTCAATPAGVKAVEDEAEAAAAAGLPVELVGETELSIPVECAVMLADQAHFNPYAFCAGLAEHLSAEGVGFLEATRVTAIEEDRHGCTVRAAGLSIRCDVAVQTTHLPVVDPALIAGRVRPERSYALAGPMEAAPSGMYLAPDAGWSIRPWPSSDQTMVIVGGQGHSMTDHVETTDHYAELARWASSKLGVTATHQWSAFDYAPADGVPFIGHLAPRSRRRYVATGFQKWGISTSMLSAVILGDAIAGRQNPYAELFDATRLVPTLTRDLAKSTVHVAKRWIGDRIGVPKEESVSDLAIGRSVTVRRGHRLVALARTGDGELHAVDPVCPHLGCIVEFNAGEETWDCPCHGSRFTADGNVIDGPATEPLERRDPLPASPTTA